jgi:hypothetical protein
MANLLWSRGPGGLNEAPRDLASSGRDLKLQLVGDDALVGAIAQLGG